MKETVFKFIVKIKLEGCDTIQYDLANLEKWHKKKYNGEGSDNGHREGLSTLKIQDSEQQVADHKPYINQKCYAKKRPIPV